MTETAEPAATAGTGTGAGAMLRAARERQGMHLAVLAASVKVTPRKLEALEEDRWEELPDATFVRALAQTICRQLKVDPAPVLARLPALGGSLGPPRGGLNQPFRDRQGHDSARLHGASPQPWRPLVWAAAALLVAALLLLVLPDLRQLLPAWGAVGTSPTTAPPTVVVTTPLAVNEAVPAVAAAAPASASTADAAASSAAAREGQTETVFATPAELGGSASAPVAGLLGVSTSEPSWVEVRDARGRLLLARTVTPGEGVGLDGALPLRVTIGNAAATTIVFRGQPVDVAARTRDNVARLELQ